MLKQKLYTRTCSRCSVEISFKNKHPIELDGKPHNCARRRLWGDSSLLCPGCESKIQKESGEWLGNRWFPAEDYRSLTCPCCNWGVDWYVSRSGLEYPEVEKFIKEQSEEARMGIGYRKYQLVRSDHSF